MHLKNIGAVTGFLILFFFVSGVAGAGILIDTPSSSYSYNEVITLPVYILDAEDIVGISLSVRNTVPGTVITINETEVRSDGWYVVNSDTGQDTQHLVWVSTKGITAEKMPIFLIDIIAEEWVSQVPIVLTINEIASDSEGILPIEEYPVTGLTLLKFSGRASGDNPWEYHEENMLVADIPDENMPDVPVDMPETPANTETVLLPVPPLQTAEHEETVVQSPGFSLALMIPAFLGLMRYRRG